MIPNLELSNLIIEKQQVEEIAKLKMPDLNCKDLDGALRSIMGTARSMGLEVK